MDIILEVYAERNEKAFDMSKTKKKKIENELIAQTKNIEEFTNEIKVNIKKKFIELFNNC